MLLEISAVAVGQPPQQSRHQEYEGKYNGFVVTMDNEKVTGFTRRVGSDKDRGTRIQVLKVPGGPQQIFLASDLLGYAIGKDTFRVFHSLQPFIDREEEIFAHAEAKIIENGKLVLYDIATISGLSYAPSPPGAGVPSSSVPNFRHTKLVRARSGELVGIDRDNFKIEMQGLLKDAPDMLEDIENGKLKFRHLKNVVRAYNARFRGSTSGAS
jgi:hypothetical protein